MKTQILNHAEKCGDDECCGLVIDNQHYIECKNIAADKQNNFEISPDDWIKAESMGQITAIVHSHPSGLAVLSEADQYFREQTKLDWWIVCNNQIYKYRYFAPLLGREFNHGITDCLSIVIDAYMLTGIDIPNYEREDDWWDNGKDYYSNLLPDNDFYQVRLNKIQEGDVIIFPLMSKVANHAAIYIGNNSILHHLPKRLSKRDLLDGYWLKHYHSVWRHKRWQSSNFTAILNNMVINTK